jgi:hypothetical protein
MVPQLISVTSPEITLRLFALDDGSKGGDRYPGQVVRQNKIPLILSFWDIKISFSGGYCRGSGAAR